MTQSQHISMYLQLIINKSYTIQSNMILQTTVQISCKTHKWRTLETSRQQCALPRWDHSPSCCNLLARCCPEPRPARTYCSQFSWWFLSELRPALYLPPVFLSEDPNAILSLSMISHIQPRLSITTAHSRMTTTGPTCRALAKLASCQNQFEPSANPGEVNN